MTDWMWVYENPKKAADEIDSLRDTLLACAEAMKISQSSKYPTDWTHMIAAIEKTVGNTDREPEGLT